VNLTRRFSLTHGFIALLAVLVTLGVMFGAARLLFWNEVHESQNRQLGDFALQSRESFFGNEDVGNCNFIRQAVKDETVAFVSFVDAQKKPRLVLPGTLRNFDFSSGGKNLPDGRPVSVLSRVVQAGGREIGTVAIGYDTRKVEAKVWDQMVRWVGLGAMGGASALLVALVVSFFLARQLARPLRRIRDGTEQVRLGKRDKLVDVDRSDEIGDLARDFNEMVAKLNELEAMKRDFVAGVTHDFGTPLHAIKTASELMQNGMAGPLSEAQAEYLLMISNSTIQLTSFVNNLLTTAQIEAAKSVPFYEPLDPKALAMEVAGLYHAQARKQGLELTVLCETFSGPIVSDVIMLRQILTNLVSNAMKYTLKGSITILLSQKEGAFVVQVRDTGVGIDPKFKDLVFDKFFRIHQPKDFPPRDGSGLGLSIVKGLAEAMGGSVKLESQLGVGTTITLRFPLRPDESTNGRGV